VEESFYWPDVAGLSGRVSPESLAGCSRIKWPGQTGIRNLPPTRQFVEGKKCCFLVDFKDISETSDIILMLLNDDCMQAEMGKNGNKLIKEHYNWEIEEKKLLSLYCQLTGGTIH